MCGHAVIPRRPAVIIRERFAAIERLLRKVA
jgi:hypothetical protein